MRTYNGRRSVVRDLMDKQALRERIWDELEDSGEARFPSPP